MASKQYHDEILNQLSEIGTFLKAEAASKGITDQDMATQANLTKPSVRSVYEGKTGNIGTWLCVARVLGHDIKSIAANLKSSVGQN